MRFRGKSIRRKIVVLLLVPLVSLLSIWGFATYITAAEANSLLRLDEITHKIGNPTEDAVRAIQRERRQIMVHVADPGNSQEKRLLQQVQGTTDRKISVVRRNASDSGLRSDLGPESKARLGDFLEALDGLKSLRSRVEHNTVTRGGVFQAYNELIDPAYALVDSLSAVDDVDLEKQGRALVGLSRAREYLSREDALMAAAYAAGQFTRGDQRALSDRVAERNIAYESNLPSLPAEDRQLFENYWNGSDGRTLRSYEDAVIAAGPRTSEGPIDEERWHLGNTTVLDDLQRMGEQARKRFQKRVDPVATRVLVQAAAAGVLGFLAVLASLVISIRVARSLVRDLNTLRKEANEAAGQRLPSVMRRLAAGDKVDVETESPSLEYPADEMGQVGQALNTLQRAAVEAAVKQADMRRGVSEVFVNLARRNQVLLHRQLTLLDAMERRTEDADELADLFKLDHLTTRMRRHAEGLVILSGAAPSRQWRKPVQLMDVVRAAVAEVEDYERIEVRRLPRLAVDGSAVADLTHLIAELLENATVFSPPHTAVQVLGERVANGFTLEIHDRGLGMTADAMLDANLRLAETPEFELSDTDRLGLFVVSRLAQRQGVRVSLQPSPYGGTTAVVLIPGTVLTETSGRDEDQRGPGATAIEAGKSTHPLNGPVELEAPLEEEPRASRKTSASRKTGAPRESRGGPRRRRPDTAPASAAGEQHQQTRDEAPPAARANARAETAAGPGTEPGTASGAPSGAGTGPGDSGGSGTGGPAPLPRRRPGAPVLVSDNGRTVDPDRRPTDEGASESGRAPLPRRKPGTNGRTGPGSRQDAASRPGSGTAPDEGAAEDRPTAEARTEAEGSARTGGSSGTAGEAEQPSAQSEAAGGRVGGLPRRVRQASLAPQLKADTPTADTPMQQARTGTQGSSSSEVDDRDADEVRSRMASLQRGWERGRRESEPPQDAGESAPGTTPGGDGR
ncbi:nitrate- and nitrite sensing domain-containing protein [Streptomyces oryzae]|uniref:histidine kinase n=1 Tax=Streptomyces oryzae TaxID=1434886 RepID=A0ABS3X6L7_9ACTN|nr:nitrate- and nitrite sensing domain-containing protein [Streptomyces oryzae]MBO8190983.1 nitrate- and nitrite sensing domain-containing protein [Streptomyces oryzae]